MFLVVLFLSNTSSRADHLIGGYFNYKPSSFNDSLFQISLVLLRDKLSAGAEHDSFVPIQVFTKDDNGNFEYVETSNQVLDSLSSKQSVQNSIQVEYGFYHFLYQIEDPSKDFYFVYQRCCLSKLINNINFDGVTSFDGFAGVSIVGQISKEAMQMGNSSFSFSELPKFIVETNFDNKIDLNLFDQDGDSLYVEFDQILLGGGEVGLLGESQQSECDGLKPEGPCPPPYDVLPYLDPDAPILGWDNLEINKDSISGIPRLLNFSMYAYSVKEYRNGLLINEQSVLYPIYTTLVSSLDETATSFKLYPNPSNGLINVISEFPIDKIQVYNSNGLKVFEDNVQSPSHSMQFEGPKGVYLVKVIRGENSVIQKWVYN